MAAGSGTKLIPHPPGTAGHGWGSGFLPGLVCRWRWRSAVWVRVVGGTLRVGGPAAVCRSAWGTAPRAGGPAAVHPRAGGPAAPGVSPARPLLQAGRGDDHHLRLRLLLLSLLSCCRSVVLLPVRPGRLQGSIPPPWEGAKS